MGVLTVLTYSYVTAHVDWFWHFFTWIIQRVFDAHIFIPDSGQRNMRSKVMLYILTQCQGVQQERSLYFIDGWRGKYYIHYIHTYIHFALLHCCCRLVSTVAFISPLISQTYKPVLNPSLYPGMSEHRTAEKSCNHKISQYYHRNMNPVETERPLFFSTPYTAIRRKGLLWESFITNHAFGDSIVPMFPLFWRF